MSAVPAPLPIQPLGVAEQAQAHGGIGFVEHLRIGLPLTLLTTLVGALWLVALLPAR